jgi:hypothetical protein
MNSRKRRQTQRSRRALPDREILPTYWTPIPSGKPESPSSELPQGSSRRGVHSSANTYSPLRPPRKARNAALGMMQQQANLDMEIDELLEAEWRCKGCGVSTSETKAVRRGPDGERSICMACSLYFAKYSTFKTWNQTERQVVENQGLEALEQSMGKVANVMPTMGHFSAVPTAPPTSFPPKQMFLTPQQILAIQQQQQLMAHVQQMQPGFHSPMAAPHVFQQMYQQSSPAPSPQLPAAPPMPEWVSKEKQRLLASFPCDRFDIVWKPASNAYKVICHDCPGKLHIELILGKFYALGNGETLENFEVHLRNRNHRAT